jgi:hypothetical protein
VRRLWAVARTTLREAVRTRTVPVVAIVLIAIVALSPFLLRHTGKLVDHVQLVLSYSLGAVGFLLAIMTIFLSASTLAGDLREKRIETIATKPIPRWQILVGKWLAVMVLNVALVVVSGAITYGLVRWVIGRPDAAENKQERKELVNEVYTARHTVDPSRPDAEIEEFIDAEIARKRDAGQLAEDFNEETYRRRRRKELWISYNTLPPGYVCQYRFEGVQPAQPDQEIYIRYKLIDVGGGESSAEKKQIWIDWTISPEETLPIQKGIVTRPELVSLGDFQEFTVPARLVSADGVLYVTCRNDTHLPGAPASDMYAAFPAEKGIQVLYKAGSFEGNVVRTMLLVLIRLAFLSALAVAAASLLSFPVASMFVLFVFVCALLVNQFVGLAAPVPGSEDDPEFRTPPFYRLLLQGITAVVPNFGRYDGTGDVATGRLVPWPLVVRGFLIIGAVYSGVVMLLGCLYFRSRELVETE